MLSDPGPAIVHLVKPGSVCTGRHALPCPQFCASSGARGPRGEEPPSQGARMWVGRKTRLLLRLYTSCVRFGSALCKEEPFPITVFKRRFRHKL